MKRLLSIVAIVLGIQFVAFAQPTITFPSVNPCPETNNIDFCMDVTVKDFTDILAMEYSIVFDPEIIQFTGVNPLGLDGLTTGNFDVSQAAEGIITLSWRIGECTAGASGVTLPDETAIYQLCFSAQGAYGAATEVAISNEPLDIRVERDRVCEQNIGLYTEPGIVSTCVRPLSLIASMEEANEGDDVCVNYSVAGFDNMTSMQFSVNWDSDILRFKEVIVLDNLINLSESGFGTPDEADIPPGALTASWAYVDPSDDSGVTLEDSTIIFQVCYEVVGPCESSTSIDFTGTPTPLEATNTVREGFEITVLSEPGGVQVGDCDPTGLQLIANCGDPVNLNDEVCVQVTTAGFQNILELQHLLNWNPFILEFSEVRNWSTDIVGLGQNDFQTENVLNGVLGLDWQTVANISQSVPDGTVLYEVCFKVVGLGGDSPIRFPSRPARVRTTTANNIGIAPTNCAVQVIQPDGVTMTLDNVEVPKGETTCIDFSVNNFEDIVRTQFSLAWDTAHITFQEIQNITLPEATAANFDLAGINGGSLVFEWEPGQARSVPDGQSIFSLCFEATGDPNDCQLIEIVDLPRATEVISASSNGNNIGLTGQGGEVCVLNPKGFTLDIGQGEGFQGDTVCVPFRVADFDGITSAEFEIGWDPSALAFVEVTTAGPLGLTPEANFEVNSTNLGILGFAWSDAAGATLPDTTLLFNVCYELIGPRNDCYEIDLSSQQPVTTLDGDGSVQLEEPGSVCIKDQLVIENVEIRPVSCPDGNDGEIILTVSGGTGTIFYNWETMPTQFSNRARNLRVGTVSVTIFDSAVPALVQTETFEVPLTDNLPQADAGEDRVATCDPDVFLLEGAGSTGPEYQYSWTTIGGSLPDARDRPSVVARGAGLYILTVRNSETFCSVTDTVEVFEAVAPIASAGQDFSFDCSADTLQLDGSGSSVADTVAYRWTALDGGAIVPGEDTLLSPRITAPGTFILEAYFTTTGCDAMDTVVVEDLRVFPDADAGQDAELSCSDDFVLLDGSGSVNEATVVYQWENEQGEVLVNDIRYQATQAGAYVLRVTDTASGCDATDTMLVVLSGEFPNVEAGDDLTLNCLADTLTLNAEVTNAPDFTFQWSAREGGAIVAGTEESLTPQVIAPGLYELVVTNTATQCVASDSVRVVEDRTPPVAEAGEGGELSCNDANFTLDGTGSSTGPEFAYTWTLDGQVVGLDTLQVDITSPGTYLLEVTNTQNGCTAVDSVVISLDSSIPQIELLPEATLNCQENVLTLAATVTPPAGNYTIEWTTADGNILTDPAALSIDIDRAGTYTLTVTNNDNGCSSTAQTVVTSDVDNPVADAGPDRTLTCLDSVAVLDGSASSTGDQFAYQWLIVDGAVRPDPSDSLRASVEVAGTYVLQVTNTLNSCSATDTVVVREDRNPPQVSIAEPDLLSCSDEMVTLDATASEFGLSYSAEWSGVNGEPVEVTENPLVANVSQAGTYQLLVRNESTGCEATTTVEVQADDSLPTADAGGDQILACPGQSLTLDGSASSSGADITYLWTVVEGSGSIQNATSAVATVTEPGTYQLEVRNNTNGCSAANTAIVSLDPALVPANAGEDMSACDDTGMLFAELPAGATGQWTTTSTAKIEAVNQASTFVEGLVDGDNVFTWTVSLPSCPDYSSDDVIIRKEIAPVANNDLANVPSGETRIDINLVANDQVNTSGEWEVNITDQPNLGRIESVTGGRAVYVPNPGVFGIDEFGYRLCNVGCPTLCDEAIVQVTVDFSEISSEDFPNTITPNGDGANDEFVFDILENAFDFWPDNELIIFNRWGDIVFRAKPYTNNWRGTTDTGQDLPDGTYYYVLRLDIPNGIIYKGDITILK